MEDKFICECGQGFTGTWCEMDVDECETDPCGRGKCINTVGGFICECDIGFGGSLCKDEIDECLENEYPCKNSGTCVDLLGTFICECAQGFTGTRCETDVNECDIDPCGRGKCINTFGGFICECEVGFGGSLCKDKIDECVENEYPCQNSGTCVDLLGTFRCECLLGFTGSLCEIQVNECESTPCKNGGVCIDMVNDFKCDCPGNFRGRLCETEISLFTTETTNFQKEMLNFTSTPYNKTITDHVMNTDVTTGISNLTESTALHSETHGIIMPASHPTFTNNDTTIINITVSPNTTPIEATLFHMSSLPASLNFSETINVTDNTVTATDSFTHDYKTYVPTPSMVEHTEALNDTERGVAAHISENDTTTTTNITVTTAPLIDSTTITKYIATSVTPKSQTLLSSESKEMVGPDTVSTVIAKEKYTDFDKTSPEYLATSTTPTEDFLSSLSDVTDNTHKIAQERTQPDAESFDIISTPDMSISKSTAPVKEYSTYITSRDSDAHTFDGLHEATALPETKILDLKKEKVDISSGEYSSGEREISSSGDQAFLSSGDRKILPSEYETSFVFPEASGDRYVSYESGVKDQEVDMSSGEYSTGEKDISSSADRDFLSSGDRSILPSDYETLFVPPETSSDSVISSRSDLKEGDVDLQLVDYGSGEKGTRSILPSEYEISVIPFEASGDRDVSSGYFDDLFPPADQKFVSVKTVDLSPTFTNMEMSSDTTNTVLQKKVTTSPASVHKVTVTEESTAMSGDGAIISQSQRGFIEQVASGDVKLISKGDKILPNRGSDSAPASAEDLALVELDIAVSSGDAIMSSADEVTSTSGESAIFSSGTNYLLASVRSSTPTTIDKTANSLNTMNTFSGDGIFPAGTETVIKLHDQTEIPATEESTIIAQNQTRIWSVEEMITSGDGEITSSGEEVTYFTEKDVSSLEEEGFIYYERAFSTLTAGENITSAFTDIMFSAEETTDSSGDIALPAWTDFSEGSAETSGDKDITLQDDKSLLADVDEIYTTKSTTDEESTALYGSGIITSSGDKDMLVKVTDPISYVKETTITYADVKSSSVADYSGDGLETSGDETITIPDGSITHARSTPSTDKADIVEETVDLYSSGVIMSSGDKDIPLKFKDKTISFDETIISSGDRDYSGSGLEWSGDKSTPDEKTLLSVIDRISILSSDRTTTDDVRANLYSDDTSMSSVGTIVTPKVTESTDSGSHSLSALGESVVISSGDLSSTLPTDQSIISYSTETFDNNLPVGSGEATIYLSSSEGIPSGDKEVLIDHDIVSFDDEGIHLSSGDGYTTLPSQTQVLKKATELLNLTKSTTRSPDTLTFYSARSIQASTTANFTVKSRKKSKHLPDRTEETSDESKTVVAASGDGRLYVTEATKYSLETDPTTQNTDKTMMWIEFNDTVPGDSQTSYINYTEYNLISSGDGDDLSLTVNGMHDYNDTYKVGQNEASLEGSGLASDTTADQLTDDFEVDVSSGNGILPDVTQIKFFDHSPSSQVAESTPDMTKDHYVQSHTTDFDGHVHGSGYYISSADYVSSGDIPAEATTPLTEPFSYTERGITEKGPVGLIDTITDTGATTEENTVQTVSSTVYTEKVYRTTPFITEPRNVSFTTSNVERSDSMVKTEAKWNTSEADFDVSKISNVTIAKVNTTRPILTDATRDDDAFYVHSTKKSVVNYKDVNTFPDQYDTTTLTTPSTSSVYFPTLDAGQINTTKATYDGVLRPNNPWLFASKHIREKEKQSLKPSNPWLAARRHLQKIHLLKPKDRDSSGKESTAATASKQMTVELTDTTTHFVSTIPTVTTQTIYDRQQLQTDAITSEQTSGLDTQSSTASHFKSVATEDAATATQFFDLVSDLSIKRENETAPQVTADKYLRKNKMFTSSTFITPPPPPLIPTLINFSLPRSQDRLGPSDLTNVSTPATVETSEPVKAAPETNKTTSLTSTLRSASTTEFMQTTLETPKHFTTVETAAPQTVTATNLSNTLTSASTDVLLQTSLEIPESSTTTDKSASKTETARLSSALTSATTNVFTRTPLEIPEYFATTESSASQTVTATNLSSILTPASTNVFTQTSLGIPEYLETTEPSASQTVTVTSLSSALTSASTNVITQTSSETPESSETTEKSASETDTTHLSGALTSPLTYIFNQTSLEIAESSTMTEKSTSETGKTADFASALTAASTNVLTQSSQEIPESSTMIEKSQSETQSSSISSSTLIALSEPQSSSLPQVFTSDSSHAPSLITTTTYAPTSNITSRMSVCKNEVKWNRWKICIETEHESRVTLAIDKANLIYKVESTDQEILSTETPAVSEDIEVDTSSIKAGPTSQINTTVAIPFNNTSLDIITDISHSIAETTASNIHRLDLSTVGDKQNFSSSKSPISSFSSPVSHNRSSSFVPAVAFNNTTRQYITPKALFLTDRSRTSTETALATSTSVQMTSSDSPHPSSLIRSTGSSVETSAIFYPMCAKWQHIWSRFKICIQKSGDYKSTTLSPSTSTQDKVTTYFMDAIVGSNNTENYTSKQSKAAYIDGTSSESLIETTNVTATTPHLVQSQTTAPSKTMQITLSSSFESSILSAGTITRLRPTDTYTKTSLGPSLVATDMTPSHNAVVDVLSADLTSLLNTSTYPASLSSRIPSVKLITTTTSLPKLPSSTFTTMPVTHIPTVTVRTSHPKILTSSGPVVSAQTNFTAVPSETMYSAPIATNSSTMETTTASLTPAGSTSPLTHFTPSLVNATPTTVSSQTTSSTTSATMSSASTTMFATTPSKATIPSSKHFSSVSQNVHSKNGLGPNITTDTGFTNITTVMASTNPTVSSVTTLTNSTPSVAKATATTPTVLSKQPLTVSSPSVAKVITTTASSLPTTSISTTKLNTYTSLFTTTLPETTTPSSKPFSSVSYSVPSMNVSGPYVTLNKGFNSITTSMASTTPTISSVTSLTTSTSSVGEATTTIDSSPMTTSSLSIDILNTSTTTFTTPSETTQPPSKPSSSISSTVFSMNVTLTNLTADIHSRTITMPSTITKTTLASSEHTYKTPLPSKITTTPVSIPAVHFIPTNIFKIRTFPLETVHWPLTHTTRPPIFTTKAKQKIRLMTILAKGVNQTLAAENLIQQSSPPSVSTTSTQLSPTTRRLSVIRHVLDLTSNNTFPHPRKEISEYIQNRTIVKKKAVLTFKMIKVTVIRTVSKVAETGRKIVLQSYHRAKDIATTLTVTTYSRAKLLLKKALNRVGALWQYCKTGINHFVVKPLLNARVYVKHRFEKAYTRLGELFQRGKQIYATTIDTFKDETASYFENLANYYTGVYRQYTSEVKDIFESLKIPDSADS